MATDFDFDGTFDDDTNEEIEPPEEEREEEEEGEEPARRSPLRLILLLLLVLVLLCVGCFLVTRFLPDDIVSVIPGIGAPAPAPDTPVPAPTAEQALPATEEPTPVAPSEVVPAPTTEPTEEPPAPGEPTGQPTVVVTIEPAPGETEEPTEPTATTAPVPGPTATPGPTTTAGPTVVITVTTCDNNIPPIADANGPYNAMRGKGQAFVTFDGTNSTDPDGTIISHEWDFGDGSAPESGATVTHGYTGIGSYVATLTVTDDCEASSQDTAEVTIVGPTPPADNGTPEAATPTPSPPAPSASGTLGFCYRVQYGDTLSGIAWRFGVTWRDLAFVNGVSMGYFVIAGQGLFIPTAEITGGPNIYEVQPGDTLNGVAFQCGLTTTTLARANGLSANDSLSPGQILLIPPWNQR